MGFLRFLGRKQERKVEDELDVPPAPPSSMGMSGMDADLNAPFPGDELTSNLTFPKQDSKPQMQQNKGIPSMDDFNFDAPLPRMEPSRPLPSIETAKPIPRMQPLMPQPVSAAPIHQDQLQTQGKALYVEVDQFRKMVQDLSDIRSDLKKTEQVMEHMLMTEANRDKDYARYRGLLNDTQRKLVFIDKTLFKGGLQ